MDRQGGSAAVYGKPNLYKIDAVTSTTLLKWNSEDDRRKDERDNPERKGTGFAGILETECGKNADPIRVKTNGYSRVGMPTTFLINMRDYTYQK